MPKKFIAGWTDHRAVFGTSPDYHPPRPPHVSERLADGLETYWDWPEDFIVREHRP